MKIKIDENLSLAHRRILEAAGHDVAEDRDLTSLAACLVVADEVRTRIRAP